METSKRTVTVERFPEHITRRECRELMARLRPVLAQDRPQLVFDLSCVDRLDAAGVELLLYCLREVFRRDGDLKLAALSPQAQVVLDLTRCTRLFEIYATPAEAVLSFSTYLPAVVRPFHTVTETTTAAGATLEAEAPRGGKAA